VLRPYRAGGRENGRTDETETLFFGILEDRREKSMTKEYRAQARKWKKQRRQCGRTEAPQQQGAHIHDKIIGITSQKVRGLATAVTNLAQKMRGVKE
jgi:hypothetical protein